MSAAEQVARYQAAEIVLLRARLADDDHLIGEVRELRAEFARLAPDSYGHPRPDEVAALLCQARRVAEAFPGVER